MQTGEAGGMGMRRRRSRNMSLGNIIEMIDSLPQRRTKLGMNEKEEAGDHMDTADIQAWISSITKQEKENDT
jgi:signal recognition particle GTPase